jgi:hypothetical protein
MEATSASRNSARLPSAFDVAILEVVGSEATNDEIFARETLVSERQSASVIAVVRGRAGLDSARRLRDAQTIS